MKYYIQVSFASDTFASDTFASDMFTSNTFASDTFASDTFERFSYNSRFGCNSGYSHGSRFLYSFYMIMEAEGWLVCPPVFKTGESSFACSGGFDSHLLPPVVISDFRHMQAEHEK